MNRISNTKKLGVIVLASRLLGKLNLPLARVISQAAEALNVSRRAGYKEALELERRLEEAPEKESEENENLKRQNLLLRIRNRILSYERDHSEVRFASAGRHLPAEAKSLCVQILREFKGKLSLQDIACSTGVSRSSLSRWDSEADPECRFAEKPERRGSRRHVTPREAREVVRVFRNLTEDMTLEAFTAHYNTAYPERPLDRRTITRILQGAGLHRAEPKRGGRKDYHGKFKVYFPGAQVAVDGKEIQIRFTGKPQKSVTLVKEVALDIASGAVVGDVVHRHENSEGVKQVAVKAKEECRSILAFLADNRSSNAAARSSMREQSELGTIFTFPYHPETNGHLEGFFGFFCKTVGRIDIDDSSRETLARSVVDLVWKIVTNLYNHRPRKSLGFKTPLEYLKTYTVLPKEMEEAQKGLRKQKRRSRENRTPHPRLSDPAFRSLVETVLCENHFEDIEFDHALKSLVAFDTTVIESAACAFSAQSKRDGFDERKRHFAYFMGIVKNKQKALDRDRLNATADVLRARRVLTENAAWEKELENERRREQEELRTRPEAVILRYSRRLMKGHFRWLRHTCVHWIKQGLLSLRRLGRKNAQILETLTLTIFELPEFDEDLKAHMVDIIASELKNLPQSQPP